MKKLKFAVVVFFAAALLLPLVLERAAHSQSTKQKKGGPPTGQANVALNDDDFQQRCRIQAEIPTCDRCPPETEAPAAFDNAPVPDFFPGSPGDQQVAFSDVKTTFEVRDEIKDGLGPVYNAQSCAECHQNPLTGGVSQITELRAGHLDAFGNFVDAPGGSLINDRAIDAAIQERVPPLFSAGISGEEDIRTTRTSLNLRGDGFVEAISNSTLLAIADSQPNDAGSGNMVHGQAINVLVEEASAPGGRQLCRIGRFGHKDQHASLLSFSGDAYLNEIGITNRLLPTENTSLGRSVAAFDHVDDIEDDENDIDDFTDFMRATKVPPRDANIAATRDAQAGEQLFNEISCSVCHTPTISTAPAGTVINWGQFVVPEALGSKVIHPYGDFLLHDIDTGDGILQNGPSETRVKVRTAPLWGVRTHTRLMHDGLSLTFMDAISRHGGEAEYVRRRFFSELNDRQRQQIIIFLESL